MPTFLWHWIQISIRAKAMNEHANQGRTGMGRIRRYNWIIDSLYKMSIAKSVHTPAPPSQASPKQKQKQKQ